jgi:putative two-component system response regulator
VALDGPEYLHDAPRKVGRQRLSAGPQGDEIPWEGQITALADIYDALRSYRTYKPPLSHERVVEIITKGDGRVRPEHFSPELLEAFRIVEDRFPDIFLQHRTPTKFRIS